MTKHRVIEELPIVFGFIALLWVIFAVDWVLPIIDLTPWGLVPRTLGGLVGIATMPLLHGSWSHLFGNSIPLVVLLCLLAGSRTNSLGTVVGISLLGASLLWLFGRPHIHIGASGLVYGLVAFLLAAGFFERRPVSIVIALVVGFLYGGTLLFGVLPTAGATVSWDGHLFGAIAGGVVAFAVTRQSDSREPSSP
jgi:membrane associated rhomboid family serine protease